MGTRHTAVHPARATARPFVWISIAALVASLLVVRAPLVGEALWALGGVLGLGLAYAAHFIVRAAVGLATLSLVSAMYFQWQQQRPAPQLVAAPAMSAAGGALVLDRPVFTLANIETREDTRRATPRDWSLMVHVSCWLWLLIGFGLSALVGAVGIGV